MSKAYLYQKGNGFVEICLVELKSESHCFVGTIEIEQAKKTVTKEVVPETESLGALDGSTLIGFRFPKNFHDIKCTYEVEE